MKKLLILAFGLLLSVPVAAQDVTDYQKYFGEYIVENGPFEKFIINERDGSFWGEAVGQGDSELLLSEVENTFKLASIADATLAFNADDNGIFNSLTLTMDQGTISAKRLFPALDEFNGTYYVEDGPVSSITITNSDGVINASTPEMGDTYLENTNILNQFLEPNYDSDFIFTRNEDGVVTGININVKSQGMTIMAEKEMEAEVEENPIDFYVGEYEFSDFGFRIKVENRDGEMYVSSDQGEGFMRATDETHTFKADGMDVKLEFKVNESNEITETILDYQGQPMSGFPVAD